MTDAPPRWTEYQPVADLLPALRNAKGHAEPAMRASVAAFGFVEPVVVDERTGRLLSGHGRVEHLTDLAAEGAAPPDGVVVGEDGRWQWLVVRGVRSTDDDHAEAMGLALNRVGELGGWVPDVLAQSLDALRTADLLDATGFSSEYLDDLIAEGAKGVDDQLAGDDQDDGRAPDTGAMLAIADVTFGEPEHVVQYGEVWHLGKHVLVVAKLHRDHHLWRDYLTDGMAFAPYPDPYITTGNIADEMPLLLIQPNLFLAGHLIDKHSSTHPDDTVERAKP